MRINSIISLISAFILTVSSVSIPNIVDSNSLVSRNDAVLTNLETGESKEITVYQLPDASGMSANNAEGESSISYYAVLSGDSFSQSQTDNGYGLTAYLTVYYNRTVYNNNNYGKITKVTGSWVISDSSYELSSREVSYGENGKATDSTWYQKSYTKYPSSNTFTYTTTNEFTKAINLDAGSSDFGANSEVIITRHGSSWSLDLSCYY